MVIQNNCLQRLSCKILFCYVYKIFLVLFVDPKHMNWRREDINSVSPLLEAYQTSLEEKDVTIESYKNELARFSSRSREIAVENENLYQQLEEANEKVSFVFIELLVYVFLFTLNV